MSDARPTLVIGPGVAGGRYWRDLWSYRELMAFLAWRDVLVRYKQTAIGVAWAVLRPLVTMVVFTLLFGKLAGFSSGEAPYAIFVLAGVLPWQFFSNALTESAGSLIANTNLLSKVYFPRLVVPLSTVLVSAIDFAISLALLAALMAWYRFVPGWRIGLLPLFLAQAFFACFGLGLWLAALNVKYRDFRYVVPFIVQLGLYLSPVGFPSAAVPEAWRLAFSLNPMVGVIEGFRWAILPGTHLDWPTWLVSAGVTAALTLIGIVYFRKTERQFADLV